MNQVNKVNCTAWCDGNIPSAKALENILNELENRKVNSKISNIFHDYHVDMMNLKHIPDKQIKNKYQTILFINIKNRINNDKKIPEKVASHLLCVISALHRSEMVKYLIYKKHEKREKLNK